MLEIIVKFLVVEAYYEIVNVIASLEECRETKTFLLLFFAGMGGDHGCSFDISAQNFPGKSREREPGSNPHHLGNCQRLNKIEKTHFFCYG